MQKDFIWPCAANFRRRFHRFSSDMLKVPHSTLARWVGSGAVGLVLVAAALSGSAVSAEPADSQTAAAPPATSNTGSAGELQEVTVTARRVTESLSKVPIAVSAFNSDVLVEHTIVSETDLQSLVPGLTVKATATQNQLNYAIRGQTLDAFSGSAPGVLPYLNDVAIAPQTASTFYDLSEIQVLKGPQGTLFGRNTTGGAVLYQTTQPGDTFGGYATLRFGNYNLNEYQGAVDLPLDPGKLVVRIAGDVHEETGYVKNVYAGTTLGDVDAKSGRVTIKLTPIDHLTSTTVFQYGSYGGTEIDGGLYSYYAIGQTNNGHALVDTAALFFTAGGPMYTPQLAAKYPLGIAGELAQQKAWGPWAEALPYTPLHRTHGTFSENTTTYDFTPDFTIKNIASIIHDDARTDAAESGAPLGVLDLANYPSTVGVEYTTDQWSEELQLQGKAFDEKLKYIGGFYAASQTVASDIPVEVGLGFVGNGLSAPIQEFHYNSTNVDRTDAVFAQGTYDLSDLVSGLSATVGGRETWEELALDQNSTSLFAGSPDQHMREQAPSWTFSLEDQITQELMIYAATRGSWRAGNFNGTTTPVDNQNEFGPEKTHDVEVGAKFSGPKIHFNVAVYDQIVHNVQRDLYFVVDGTPSSFTHNVPEARIEGVELDGEILATSWLRLGANGAFTDASYPEGVVTVFGQTLDFTNYQDTPRWSGSAFAQLTLPAPDPWGPMSVRADIYYQTNQTFSSLEASIAPGTTLPAYALLNLRYDWREMMGTHVSLGVFAKNVLNRQYYLGGQALGPDVGFNEAVPGAPRTFGVELNYKF
jgi:iron complex outermembrane receptor protein